MAAAQSPLGRGVLGRGVNREPFWFLAAADSPCQGNCDASFHDLHCASLARAGFLTSVVCQPILHYHPNLRCPRHPRHPAGLLLLQAQAAPSEPQP